MQPCPSAPRYCHSSSCGRWCLPPSPRRARSARWSPQWSVPSSPHTPRSSLVFSRKIDPPPSMPSPYPPLCVCVLADTRRDNRNRATPYARQQPHLMTPPGALAVCGGGVRAFVCVCGKGVLLRARRGRGSRLTHRNDTRPQASTRRCISSFSPLRKCSSKWGKWVRAPHGAACSPLVDPRAHAPPRADQAREWCRA